MISSFAIPARSLSTQDEYFQLLIHKSCDYDRFCEQKEVKKIVNDATEWQNWISTLCNEQYNLYVCLVSSSLNYER